MNEGYAKLRFFRDLTEGQRRDILITLGALDHDEWLPQLVQHRVFKWLVKRGQLDKIVEMTEGFIMNKSATGEQK